MSVVGALLYLNSILCIKCLNISKNQCIAEKRKTSEESENDILKTRRKLQGNNEKKNKMENGKILIREK